MKQKTKQKMNLLRINKKLPQIVLPEDKIEMFIDWYNRDLRFLNSIPNSFDEGYIILSLKKMIPDINVFSSIIKECAKEAKTTYRFFENQFKEYFETIKNITVYFKFIKENYLLVYIYGSDNKIISSIEAEIGDKVLEPIKWLKDNNILKSILNSTEDVYNTINEFILVLVSTILWYLATTTKTIKYYYEKTYTNVSHEGKTERKVKETRIIKTPIYDLTKIRKVPIDRLITRRKGWTYSHSFIVQGHYRHYKDGKTIFVKSYEKGKGKERINQRIIINPEK